MNTKILMKLCGSLIIILIAHPLWAHQFHYQEILIGDRAIGMGGAYGGVSDDASGVYYNPAGLAFGLANDISGSANAFYTRNIRFKNIIGNRDFVEKSSGSVPSFFGGVQKLDHIYPGLVFGFAVYSTSSDLKDQDDLIPEEGLGPINLGNPGGCDNGTNRLDTELVRFHRTVNRRGSTTNAGGGLGLRLSNQISIGLGANYITVDELVQEYQDTKSKKSLCTDAGVRNDTEQLSQNIREYLTAVGIQPVLGVQATLWQHLSLGLTLKFGTYLSQTYERSTERRTVSLENTDQENLENAATKSVSTSQSALVTQVTDKYDTEVTKESPLGTVPTEARLGAAYFASSRLLMTGDLTYHSSVEADLAQYSKNSVINLALGMEYYLTPAFPLRAGIFTNLDSRPKLKENTSGQRDHIDYTGGTVFITWAQPNSHIGAGVIYQMGTGQAQKLEGGSLNDVEASTFTLALSATHSF